MSKVVMLSTVDNPYNPFTHYDEWFQYDAAHGYGSCEILDRVTHTSDGLSEEEYNEAIEDGVDTFLKYDFTGIYRKVIEGEPFNGPLESLKSLEDS